MKPAARIKPGSIIPKRQPGDGTIRYMQRKARANIHAKLKAEIEAQKWLAQG